MSSPRESTVHLWRDATFDDVDLLRGSFVNHSFPIHYHDGFGFGVIEEGALGFRYRGEEVIASKGMVNLVNPDEMHNGHDFDGKGWSYRMFYLPASLLEELYSEFGGTTQSTPFFPMGTLNDPHIAQRVASLHQALEYNVISGLEKEQEFYRIIHLLLSRYADRTVPTLHIGRESQRIKKVTSMIQEMPEQEFSIAELAKKVDLTPWHFIRVFTKEVGITPHAYVTQVRVHYAARLLRCGYAISETANLSGFSDQSHLHRNFKKIFALTPGQYRNFVQY